MHYKLWNFATEHFFFSLVEIEIYPEKFKMNSLENIKTIQAISSILL